MNLSDKQPIFIVDRYNAEINLYRNHHDLACNQSTFEFANLSFKNVQLQAAVKERG